MLRMNDRGSLWSFIRVDAQVHNSTNTSLQSICSSRLLGSLTIWSTKLLVPQSMKQQVARSTAVKQQLAPMHFLSHRVQASELARCRWQLITGPRDEACRVQTRADNSSHDESCLGKKERISAGYFALALACGRTRPTVNSTAMLHSCRSKQHLKSPSRVRG